MRWKFPNTAPKDVFVKEGNDVLNQSLSPQTPSNTQISGADIPKLDATKFSLPVGVSWFDYKAVADWVKLRTDKEEEKRNREKAQITRLILTNPELAGQDPEAWTLSGIISYLKQIKADKEKEKEREINRSLKQEEIKRKRLEYQAKEEELNKVKKINAIFNTGNNPNQPKIGDEEIINGKKYFYDGIRWVRKK